MIELRTPLIACLSLFIDRFQRSCFLFILSTDQIMVQFSSVFPPHLLISCWAVTHFSASFLFYLFRSFLNSPFSACDTPTFQLFRPNFTEPCSLGPVWYTCLKTENCCLKTFVKICVGKKVHWNVWNVV